jgi:aspartyl-tRNA(Asn)/glutamyl-tRNA(Gln) amidotransferase subunit C
MSVELPRETVEHVALLARLALTEEEKALFARQLADILAYARQVQQVETRGVPPTTHVLSAHPALRADEPAPSLPRDEALEGAPEAATAEGLFKVPRVIA